MTHTPTNLNFWFKGLPGVGAGAVFISWNPINNLSGGWAGTAWELKYYCLIKINYFLVVVSRAAL